MNEQNNGKKQAAALWILGILVVILIAIIVGLFITQAQTRNQEVATKDVKIAQLQKELSEVKKQNEKTANTIEETIKQNNDNLTSEIAKKDETIKQLENQISELKKTANTETQKNDILEEIKEKAEETIRWPLFNEDTHEINNAISCVVKAIKIFDAEYMKIAVDSYDNKDGIYKYQSDYDESMIKFFRSKLEKYSSNPEEMPVVGTITFMIKYDGIANGYWAGNGPTFKSGEYTIGSREFEYKNGELMLNTGGTFML